MGLWGNIKKEDQTWSVQAMRVVYLHNWKCAPKGIAFSIESGLILEDVKFIHIVFFCVAYGVSCQVKGKLRLLQTMK